VHLLDELVRQTPEGVYLKSITQKGLRVNLTGYAQSNARVSTLMRNIEGSTWLEKPELIEVKASTVDKRRLSEFNMFLSLKRVADQKAAPAAPAAPAKDAAKKN
jgi:type IV pilus assembly protein PilN